MSKSSCLCDGAANRDWNRIGGAREGAGPGACPAVEAVARGWPCRDRDGRAAVFPSTGGSHCATGSVGHRQEILLPEIRGVSLINSGSNSVRDSSAVAPTCPYVLDARAAALRRSCGNDVA